MNSTIASRMVLVAVSLLTAAACLAADQGPKAPAPPKVFLETSVASTFAAGDYRLSEASKYGSTGTDGKALGADIDALEAAVKKAK